MSNFIFKLLRILLISLIPVILILGVTRLLATDSYLAFEYGKSSFPPDPYGFTPQQRFILASTNIHYVRAHLPDDELSKQTVNGVPVYNEREVAHMADVQAVFQIILRIWQVAFILILLLSVVFVQNGKRDAFVSAIQWGGLVTAGIIFAIALLAIFAWQTWFNLFHRFLFVPGSWLFSYTDTLIRLFPTQFWFDATVTISVLAFVGGILLAVIGWRGKVLLSRPLMDVMQAA